MKFKHFIIGILGIVACLIAGFKKERPVLYLIGDSTVASAPSHSEIQGWGGHLASFFDTTKIRLENRAVAGTSSRTYQTKGVHTAGMLKNGMWDSVMVTLKPGDFVMMQFGHNDDSPIDDTARSRGSLKGTGTDSTVIFNRFLKKQETVHTYGWYLRKFISDTRLRGAVPVICSPIPKNAWKDNRVVRNTNDYNKWCAEVAASTGTLFINLNKLIADHYDADGQAKVDTLYFVKDHIHTTLAGAMLNAGIVATGIRESDSRLKKYLKQL
jgi:lysophospholipase L1-like esterase